MQKMWILLWRSGIAVAEFALIALSFRAFALVICGPFVYFTYWVRLLSFGVALARLHTYTSLGDLTSNRFEAVVVTLNTPLTAAFGRVSEPLCIYCATQTEDVLVHVVLPYIHIADFLYIQLSRPNGALTAASVVGVMGGMYLLVVNLWIESPYSDTTFDNLTHPGYGTFVLLGAMVFAAAITLVERPIVLQPYRHLLRW